MEWIGVEELLLSITNSDVTTAAGRLEVDAFCQLALWSKCMNSWG